MSYFGNWLSMSEFVGFFFIVFTVFLGLIFVTLKLWGFLTFDWFWATMPFWGGIVLFVFARGLGIIAGD